MAVTNQMLFGTMQRALSDTLTGCIQGSHAEAVALRSRVTELTTLVEKLVQDPSSVGDSGITIVSDMHGHSFVVTQRGDVVGFNWGGNK